MPIKVKIYNQKAEIVGEEELSEHVFGWPVNIALLHQVIVAQTANQRQVLAHTKDRSEVSGGGKKPWRQKGTGRARAGSSRSPIWIGGGVTFGPLKTRNFKKSVNRKMKQAALCMVISDRLKEENLTVLDALPNSEFKTKSFNEIIKNLETKAFKKAKPEPEKKNGKTAEPKRSILIINDKNDEKTGYSARNLADVKLINSENLNIIDLLKYKNLIITLPAVKLIEARYK